MKSFLGNLFACFFGLIILFIACSAQGVGAKKIGIILPMEHKALNEIVAGFTQELRATYKQPLQFKISNAAGDLNLQRSIIMQMQNANYDLLVPVATTVTQMAASMVHAKPILGLAARLDGRPSNLVTVDDEVDKRLLIGFIRAVYPKLNRLTLIHSVSDKVFVEIDQVKSACLSQGIRLHTVMVQSLSDLYSVGRSLPSGIEAILILKDSLIACGIDTLVQEARKRNIPLITSDDGTVKNGASFALGVYEKDIGVAGAHLASKILHGKSPSSLKPLILIKLAVFVNPKYFQNKHNADVIKRAAGSLHYPLEVVNQ